MCGATERPFERAGVAATRAENERARYGSRPTPEPLALPAWKRAMRRFAGELRRVARCASLSFDGRPRSLQGYPPSSKSYLFMVSRLQGRSHSPFARFWAAVGVVIASAVFAARVEAAPRGPAVAPTKAERTTSVASADELELQLAAALNSLRARYGMRPLRYSPALAAAAEHHSRSMARHGFFGHDSADGSPFSVRIERFYRRPTDWRLYMVGENILRGRHALRAHSVVRRWLGSPGHRRNLLGSWREVGFGAVRVNGAPGIFSGQNVMLVTANFGVRA